MPLLPALSSNARPRRLLFPGHLLIIQTERGIQASAGCSQTPQHHLLSLRKTPQKHKVTHALVSSRPGAHEKDRGRKPPLRGLRLQTRPRRSHGLDSGDSATQARLVRVRSHGVGFIGLKVLVEEVCT